MHNRFDFVAKQIGEEALGQTGQTVTHAEIHAETQYADLLYEPDPARAAERAHLGLLGRLAAEPCLIECYSQAPNAEEFRACLSKHLASWQARARAARAGGRRQGAPTPPVGPLAEPSLWIITAGVPVSLLAQLRPAPAPGWPPGVYQLGDRVLRVGIVVASELPRDQTTVLVRLMAAGPLLAPAVAELAALPRDARERAIAEPALLQFQRWLGRDPGRRLDPDEQEFMMAMLKTWEDARTEGRTEGRTETQADAVLTVLRVRGLTVPEATRALILAERDLERLKRWHEKAIVAGSASEIIDDPS